MSIHSNLYVSNSNIHGNGVFARHKIQHGDTIEYCPIIEVYENQIFYLRKTNLINYYYMWNDDLKSGAVALGYGSIYNHSFKPNAIFERMIKERIIEIIAISDIEKDEEITINYNGDPNDKDPLDNHYRI